MLQLHCRMEVAPQAEGAIEMQCPACGTVNTEKTRQCVCGHYFAPPAKTAGIPEANAAVVAAEMGATETGGAEWASRRLSFQGDGGDLFGIYIVNLLLSVLTLGVYYFWGKVKVRQYLYSQSEFEGDRFAFHGNGKELFIGWLKAAVAVGLFFGVMIAIQSVWQGPTGETLTNLFFYGSLLILIPVVIVGSRRYRLSRTSWRGIRFSFRGHAKELIRTFARDGILTGLTFGIYYSWLLNNIRKFVARNSCFGNTSFDYDGDGGDLFGIHIKGFFLTLLTFGLYWFWFSAEKQRYYWDHTSFGTARFRSTVTGGELLGLKVVNWLLLGFSLGLAYPWVRVRETQFLFDHLVIEGLLDLASIQQEARTASATGEGMAEFLETDFLDFDLGL